MGRGLAFVMDAGIALMIFLVILMSIATLWAETYRHVYGIGEMSPLKRRAVDVSELLVKTGGDPINWYELNAVNDSNTYSLGLAREENVLDRLRLDKLNETNKTVINTIFGLAGEGFELTVTHNWTTSPNVRYNITTLNGSAATVYTAERIVLLDGERAALRLRVGR